MITRSNCFSVLVGVSLLSSCACSAHVSEVGADGRQPSFCEVAQNLEKYRGTKVELRARYVSDGKHEEVLEDATCSDGRRIIDIGRRGSSEPVARFYAERKKICSERGATYLCNTSADVDVLGVVSLMSGEFVLDVEEIVRYSFID